MAAEVWKHLHPCIRQLMEAPKWNQVNIAIDFYMIGRTKPTACPTIMIASEDKEARKQIRAALRDSGILDSYPSIALGDSSAPLSSTLPLGRVKQKVLGKDDVARESPMPCGEGVVPSSHGGLSSDFGPPLGHTASRRAAPTRQTLSQTSPPNLYHTSSISTRSLDTRSIRNSMSEIDGWSAYFFHPSTTGSLAITPRTSFDQSLTGLEGFATPTTQWHAGSTCSMDKDSVSGSLDEDELSSIRGNLRIGNSLLAPDSSLHQRNEIAKKLVEEFDSRRRASATFLDQKTIQHLPDAPHYFEDGDAATLRPPKRPASESDSATRPPVSEKPNNSSIMKRRKTSTVDEVLACPFYKREPLKYPACSKSFWQKVHRVKEHIYRKHMEPRRCPRCQQTFETDDGIADHLRSDIPCSKEPEVEWPGITLAQRVKLSARPPRNESREDQWFRMWDIIFPSTLKPQSPYLLLDPVNELHDEFRQFFSIHGAQIIFDCLSSSGYSVIKEAPGDVSADDMRLALKSALEAIDSRYMSQQDGNHGNPTQKQPKSNPAAGVSSDLKSLSLEPLVSESGVDMYSQAGGGYDIPGIEEDATLKLFQGFDDGSELTADGASIDFEL